MALKNLESKPQIRKLRRAEKIIYSLVDTPKISKAGAEQELSDAIHVIHAAIKKIKLSMMSADEQEEAYEKAEEKRYSQMAYGDDN